MELYKITNTEDLKGEEWIDIIGYDGIYSVSNLGRVKSESRYVNNGNGTYLKKTKILKQQIKKSNFNNLKETSKSLCVGLYLKGVRKTFNVSFLVGVHFLGETKKTEVYSKKNKIWSDCSASNLEILSVSDCFKLSYKKGNNNRYKKHMTYNHSPKYIFKRLIDGKEFKGGRSLRNEYGYDCQKGIKNSLYTGNKCKGSYWEVIKL